VKNTIDLSLARFRIPEEKAVKQLLAVSDSELRIDRDDRIFYGMSRNKHFFGNVLVLFPLQEQVEDFLLPAVQPHAVQILRQPGDGLQRSAMGESRAIVQRRGKCRIYQIAGYGR
jgi:hypothetical protein